MNNVLILLGKMKSLGDAMNKLRQDKMNDFVSKLKQYNMKPWDFIELWNSWMKLTPQERGRILETKED